MDFRNQYQFLLNRLQNLGMSCKFGDPTHVCNSSHHNKYNYNNIDQGSVFEINNEPKESSTTDQKDISEINTLSNLKKDIIIIRHKHSIQKLKRIKSKYCDHLS